jgi:hypothetical protein
MGAGNRNVPATKPSQIFFIEIPPLRIYLTQNTNGDDTFITKQTCCQEVKTYIP